MQFYIDAEYKCHASDDGSLRAVEDSFFDGKCEVYIEAYRYIPEGESWTDDSGEKLSGCMIAPWGDYNEALAAQREYELAQLEKYKADAVNSVALSEMDAAYKEGVNAI